MRLILVVWVTLTVFGGVCFTSCVVCYFGLFGFGRSFLLLCLGCGLQDLTLLC